MTERKGDWMQTYTGRQFWPLDPRPEDVDILDIAHALANVCRFGGHTKAFYSVAQHSVLVSRVVPAGQALAGLLHDATEAYIGDMIRPLKRNLHEYRAAEARLEAAITERFVLPAGAFATPEVKYADNVVLATEARDVMGEPPQAWLPLPSPMDRGIRCETPGEAETRFLGRFEALLHYGAR